MMITLWQACPEYGGTIESGRKLLLVCENVHVRDQDVTAVLNFLNKIEGVASTTVPPVEILARLPPYLRMMDASEVRIGLAEKQ